MPELPEPSIRARLIALGIGLSLLLPLGAIFGTWTYEGFSIYRARNSVPSGLQPAGAVVEGVWDRSGEGFHGDGVPYSYSVYGATLRVDGQDRSQTFDNLPPGVVPLERGKTVDVGLWHGQIVEIKGWLVVFGWAEGTRIVATLALYPLLLIGALTVLTQLVMLSRRRLGPGRVDTRYERGTSVRSIFWGFVAGFGLAVAAMVVISVREQNLFWWPPVSVGVALSVGILVLVRRLRRLQQPTGATGAGSASPCTTSGGS